jgi:diacylglycerol kinase family enzyme
MNLLAHDYGVPEDLEEAARVIAAGNTIPVDYGCIDGKVFLHTCFMGLPVRIGRHREDMRGKMNPFDRLRLVFHALRSLAKDPQLTLVPEGGEAPPRMESPSYALLVGTMDDKMLPRPVRQTVTGGQMTVFAIHPDSGVDIARLVVKGAFGFLSEDEDVDKYVVRSCEVSGPRRKLRAMLDGEDVLVASPAAVSIVSGEVEVFSAPRDAS